MKQEKASKLRTCYCDGTETDFPCKRLKYNTERYCYGKNLPHESFNTNEVTESNVYNHGKRHNKHKHNKSAATLASSMPLSIMMATVFAIFINQFGCFHTNGPCL